MPQARPPSNQGLKTATPVTAKCLTLRVASTMEFAMATAAICASSIGTRPGIGYFAKIRAAARSNGSTLPSKAGRTWAANQRRSTSPWAGSTASLRQTPRSISAIVNAVTNWSSCRTPLAHVATSGLRCGNRNADTTLVSRTYLTTQHPCSRRPNVQAQIPRPPTRAWQAGLPEKSAPDSKPDRGSPGPRLLWSAHFVAQA